jgi:hypothetical protein
MAPACCQKPWKARQSCDPVDAMLFEFHVLAKRKKVPCTLAFLRLAALSVSINVRMQNKWQFRGHPRPRDPPPTTLFYSWEGVDVIDVLILFST